ncbi:MULTISPECIES: ATP-dependent nuclease [Enterococcus]|uniref:ATP-dependent nuclease n=1 Tax=Enterococcus TaxID=1350 RepID=UPI001573CE4C|nr:AAA family ATPase [Enterococcus faecalis]EGO2704245.1 AAA family ATPase [Enterococcus faecalis]ELS0477740.1 AAA family ATPase [Enterococcus faecalis]MDB1106842.1 AAA family ATPase [Enterococcus faecalis]MDT2160348.1 AAA family ATPase [Enterococcus faecalis]NSN66959.1 AAA family ATPase [Enterococcus faecalis]
MILKQLKIWNFRQFSSKDDSPGLEVQFHNGVNVLIGENDSGKSTIIDAIKIVLQTQSNEYIRITEDDFYLDSAGNSSEIIKIECILSDFSVEEAKNFIEWLQFEKNDAGKTIYNLKLTFKAWKEKNRIFTDLRAGMIGDGNKMDGKARELLKCTYLKPLRDAEREMASRKGSRLSQILYNHKSFQEKENHKLVEIIKKANKEIDQYFINDDDVVLQTLKSNVAAFLEKQSRIEPSFVTSNLQLKSILESLSLNLSEIKPGLGVQNLLFIAAELLLLGQYDDEGIKLALIEEIESHLHPQAQLRLIEYIQNEFDDSGIQFILSTHSTTLSSEINIKNALICKNSKVYSLAPENTKLDKGDYLFLQRFLESSKANMFFSQGVIMVEGDAENLLLPTIAKIIDSNLSQYGVSLVNVGSIAFLRYSKIFLQKKQPEILMPVSIITDVDIKPKWDQEKKELDIKLELTQQKNSEITSNYSEGTVKTFISPHWTLEFSLALSCLKEELYKSILYAEKIANSNKYALTAKKIEEVDNIVKENLSSWTSKGWSDYRIAYEIYNNTLLEKNISKAITAQCLASLLEYQIVTTTTKKEEMFDLNLSQKKIDTQKKEELAKKLRKDKYIGYIVKAIDYSAGKD